MTFQRSLKTTFTGGEISPLLKGRIDLRAYENGAAKLRNVFVQPTGGVRRRDGTRFVDNAFPGRLIEFEFNTEQAYLLLLGDQVCRVYRGDASVATFATPWTLAQLEQIGWTQSADTLLIVHPDVEPRRITRTSDADWTIAAWVWTPNAAGTRIQQPYHKFADDGVTLMASATTGTVTLTASSPVFQPEHIGHRFRLANKEVTITAVSAGGQVSTATANVSETLADTNATRDWEEAAFSGARGWPTAVTFHQDRLVIGGSRDLPNRIWLSQSGDLFNFELGDGEDSDAMDIAILSDQVNAIRAVFSGRHLQVFTGGAEYMVTGEPLTPTNIQVRRQTRIGSPLDRTVRPINIDGTTVFASRNRSRLHEFVYSDLEQGYQAPDLGLLIPDQLAGIEDMDYDAENRLLHLVQGDGTLATVTIYRAEEVTAWSFHESGRPISNPVISMAVVSGDVYLLVDRLGGVVLERFDSTLSVDSGLDGGSTPAKTVWTGLDHLEGETVKIVADGGVVADQVVIDGAITLETPASTVEVGLAFTHIVEPLPPAINGGQETRIGRRLRPVQVEFLIHETQAVVCDLGTGLAPLPLRRWGAGVLDAPPPPVSDAVAFSAGGWSRFNTRPLWRIEQDTPLAFTLLSVSTEIIIND